MMRCPQLLKSNGRLPLSLFPKYSRTSLLGRAPFAVVQSEEHAGHEAVRVPSQESAASHVLPRSDQEDAFDQR